jgi:methylenetetrahydrofolate reductase (NADPH)
VGVKKRKEINFAFFTLQGDDQKVKEYGVSLAVSMIQHLHKEANICNFHISTLNLERSTRLILEALHLHKQQVMIFLLLCINFGLKR